MKYELLRVEYNSETTIIDAENNATDNYLIVITLYIHPTDGVASDFQKHIKVINNNSQTGFEVDAQREKAINDYITEINK